MASSKKKIRFLHVGLLGGIPHVETSQKRSKEPELRGYGIISALCIQRMKILIGSIWKEADSMNPGNKPLYFSYVLHISIWISLNI